MITRFAKWMVLCCGILRFVKLPALVFFCLCAAMFASAQCGISNLGGCPATATASPATGPAPLAVTLNTTPPFSEVPSPSTWLFSRWDFGDGQTAITAQTTHTYTVPGTYIASAYYALTSSSEDGFSSDPTVLASATITVTAPVITSLTLSPSALTMMVGDERTFALTDQDGKAITGAAWTVDLPTVATLSADDPPIITAVNPGTATITAFIGSVQTQATVNVVPYSSGHIFPPGTVLWSTPAGVSGRVLKTTPTAGAAAFIGVETDTANNTTLRGISSDGQQMWQSATLHNVAKVTPVDLGNVAVLVYENNLSSLTIRDGSTGQPAWSYANTNFAGLSSSLAVRQDGTVFTIEYEADGTSRLLGLDGATGARLVNYQLPTSTQTDVGYPNPTFNVSSQSGPLTVMPDGALYLEFVNTDTIIPNDPSAPITETYKLNLIRVDPTGSTSMQLLRSGSWQSVQGLATGELVYGLEAIPDGQGGVLASWDLQTFNHTCCFKFSAYLTHVTAGGGVIQSPMPFDSWCNDCNGGSGAANTLMLGENNVVFTTDRQNRVMAFDVNSALPLWSWPIPANTRTGLVAASWGGGLVVKQIDNATDQEQNVRFDDQGNASYEGWNSTGFTPNYVWPTLGTWYGASSNSYTVVAESEIVPTAHSPWGFPGGNPAGNRSPVVSVTEDVPLWGSLYDKPGPLYLLSSAKIPDCQKPIVIDKVTVQSKAPLTTKGSENLLARITKMKDKLLLSGTLTSPACAKFFSDPKRTQYYSQLQIAVGLQVQYDGTKSVINKYDAGMWEDGADQYAGAVAEAKSVYVSCVLAGPSLLDKLHPPATHQTITAMSQLQLPAHDAYYNENDLDYLVPGTILHEALHNLTRLYDENLRSVLDLPATNGNTSDITVKLEREGCAPKP